MKILAIDTSTAVLTTAIVDGTEVIAEQECMADRSHSNLLMGAIEDVFQQVAFEPEDLQAVAVGVGPGSYTGVRIGVTVAKTLAWSWGIPVFPVSSLEGWARSMASSIEPAALWVSPLIYARRGRVYTGLYERLESGYRWREILQDGNHLLEDWVNKCIAAYQSAENPPAEGFLFGGDIPQELFLDVRNRMELEGIKVSRTEESPRAREIARCAWERRDEIPLGSHDLVPNYTRLAEAEAKFEA